MAEKIRGRAVPFLRAWRLRRAINQIELAERAKVARSTVIRAEGGAVVSFANIRALAAALDLTVDELLFRDPDAPKVERAAA